MSIRLKSENDRSLGTPLSKKENDRRCRRRSWSSTFQRCNMRIAFSSQNKRDQRWGWSTTIFSIISNKPNRKRNKIFMGREGTAVDVAVAHGRQPFSDATWELHFRAETNEISGKIWQKQASVVSITNLKESATTSSSERKIPSSMLPSIIVDVACCWRKVKRSCYVRELAIKNRILRRTLCRLRKNLIGILQEDGSRSLEHPPRDWSILRHFQGILCLTTWLRQKRTLRTESEK